MIMAETSGWEQGGTLDTAQPSARLVATADRASGPDRRCAGMDDDDLTGVMGRWAACEAWATSAKLATIVELVRRRGLPGSAGPSGVPSAWDDTLTEEIADALGMSRPATAKLIDLAVALATRLDATAAALAAGEIDHLKAKIIGEAAGPRVRSEIHLTLPAMYLPLLTLLGVADNPGEADRWGALDPALVREMAAAAAKAGDRSEWHLTLTDERGRAVGHGCSLTRPIAKTSKRGKRDTGGADVAGGTGTQDWDGTTWTLTLPGGGTRDFTLNPIPVFGCDHRYETAGHDPSRQLRHLVNIRDGNCTQPCCSRSDPLMTGWRPSIAARMACWPCQLRPARLGHRAVRTGMSPCGATRKGG